MILIKNVWLGCGLYSMMQLYEGVRLFIEVSKVSKEVEAWLWLICESKTVKELTGVKLMLAEVIVSV